MRRKANPALAPTRVRLQTNNCTKKVRWTKEEDELLFRLLKDVDNPNWPFIAKNFPAKGTQQVTERWEKVLNPKLIKGSWTREEDQTIINFVRENGSKNWTQLAALLPGRIGKQCRERWRNHLDPNINHSMWTNDEDLMLIKLHEKFGNSWVKISQMMPGRSDNAIKNRWNSTLKRVDPTTTAIATANANAAPTPSSSSNATTATSSVAFVPPLTSVLRTQTFEMNPSNLMVNRKESAKSVVETEGAPSLALAVRNKNSFENENFNENNTNKTDNNDNSMISFVSPFKNLISPGIQKTQQGGAKERETSPRATTVESNRQKFLVLLEREEGGEKTEKHC